MNIPKLLFTSGREHDKRIFCLKDVRPTSTDASSLNVWDIVEVPRKVSTKHSEGHPFRAVVLNNDHLPHIAQSVLAIDLDAKKTHMKPRLQLHLGILKRVSFQEAKDMGLVAGVTVVEMK